LAYVVRWGFASFGIEYLRDGLNCEPGIAMHREKKRGVGEGAPEPFKKHHQQENTALSNRFIFERCDGLRRTTLLEKKQAIYIIEAKQ
jgi:hypothetical protein